MPHTAFQYCERGWSQSIPFAWIMLSSTQRCSIHRLVAGWPMGKDASPRATASAIARGTSRPNRPAPKTPPIHGAPSRKSCLRSMPFSKLGCWAALATVDDGPAFLEMSDISSSPLRIRNCLLDRAVHSLSSRSLFRLNHHSYGGTPFRRKGRPDEALVLWKSRNRSAILVVEADTERVEIGLLTFRTARLRYRDHAVLIKQPGDRNLSGGRAVLATNGGQRGIVRRPALRERRVRGQRNRLAAQIGKHRRLRQESMVLDLMGGDRRADLFDSAADHRQVEVAHADRQRQATLAQLHQGFQTSRNVDIPGRPVDHVEVHIIEPQLAEAKVECAAQRIGRQLVVPDLCRDE